MAQEEETLVEAKLAALCGQLLTIGVLPNGWDVHGKPGSGFPVRADGSPDWDRSYGWFIGWASKGGRTFVFARCIQDDKRESANAGLRVRDTFLEQLPSVLYSL
jgi:beta-lactamase class D